MSDEYEHDPTLLTNYLCQAYLPPLVLDSNLPAAPQYAQPWPRIDELDMDRPRLVRLVSEIPLAALQNAIRLYYAGFENRLRIDWENTRLTLPCPGVTVLGPSAVARLSVCCEHDFLAALEHFVLGTAAEAVRTVERRQFDEDELEFQRVLVSSARNAKKLWTLHTFGPQAPPTGLTRPGIVVVSIPPWKLGLGNLHEFSCRRMFLPGELDREYPSNTVWSNDTKLWAMVYDSCRVSGYRWFVVTTYQYWVFGTFSLDWSGAEATPPVPFDRTRGMSIVEMLTFWIECSRDKTKYWHISANAQ
ncbi:hypothetical protein C8Q73DRAFT_788923 [Cubamyces lactineus]|nr:hypothetical protein C8Q73DRAFT_788923 [Cubamyces lactineus]